MGLADVQRDLHRRGGEPLQGQGHGFAPSSDEADQIAQGGDRVNHGARRRLVRHGSVLALQQGRDETAEGDGLSIRQEIDFAALAKAECQIDPMAEVVDMCG